MDYIIREFKKEVVETLNKRILPLEIKRMILQELLIEVSQLADQSVEVQRKQAEQEEIDNGNPD